MITNSCKMLIRIRSSYGICVCRAESRAANATQNLVHIIILHINNDRQHTCRSERMDISPANMFLRFSFRKELRVCGAEVERTLQKCGGSVEFAIKNIAYHSLSILFFNKFHHFTKSRHFFRSQSQGHPND